MGYSLITIGFFRNRSLRQKNPKQKQKKEDFVRIFIHSLLVFAVSFAFQACSGQSSSGTGSETQGSNTDLSSKTFDELKEIVLQAAKKCNQESIYTNNIEKTSKNSKLNKVQQKNSLINMKKDLDNSNC